MKRKGFTLVELLAVIAILAILVIIALPNVMGLFNTAKENSFKTEVKEIFKAAQNEWMQDSMYQTGEQTYSRCDNGCSNPLDLSGRSDFDYCIKFNKNGDVITFYASDGTFNYSYNNPDVPLKIENIKDVQKSSGNGSSLTCDGFNNNGNNSGNDNQPDEPDDPYSLYDTIKNSTLAKKYTESHQDSMNSSLSTKGIYYWNAESDEEANNILDKNNIIFGGFCWQSVRTTDTGGVKLIYNGIPNDGKCNNTGANQQIGTSSFNQSSSSIADIGYMNNNNRYTYNKKTISLSEQVVESTKLNTAYWFADSVNWNSSTNKWELVNPYKVSSQSEFESLVGKYTFYSSSETASSSNVKYIVYLSSIYSYAVTLSSGKPLSDYINTYTYGNSYTDNGNGTYSINSPSSFTTREYKNNCHTGMQNKFICKNATNNVCNSVSRIAYIDTSKMILLSSTNTYKYGSDVKYENGKYKLTGSVKDIFDTSENNKEILNNYHYTCFNKTGECTSVSYVYYLLYASSLSSNEVTVYYINLTNGKKVEDALNDMLYNTSVNSNNSKIKTTIDTWYQNNLIGYSDYLEDIIFCDDRSQSVHSNGWNPNGGSITSISAFGSSDGLTCSKDTDRFSVSNGQAKLTYPIALLTYKESYLLGNRKIRATGNSYWLLSYGWYSIDPNYSSSYYSEVEIVDKNGYHDGLSASSSAGVRPVISLKPGTKFTSGDGSKNNPYVIGG